MLALDMAPGVEAFVALGIMVLMFVMFLRETFPVEVVAIGAAAAMLLLGMIPAADVEGVLGNSAPWTIAAMFVIVGALVRTGALDWVTQIATRHAERHPAKTLAGLAVAIVGISAFVNNTPIVVVMIPVFMQLARKLQVAPSKLLIPLSYLTVLGGVVTMVGTSTNLVVDGVVRAAGLPGFGIFDISAVGLSLAVAGMIYLGLFGNRLLPNRESMSMLMSDRSRMKFFTEVAVPEASSIIGKRLDEVELFKREGARVIDVLRGDASLRRDLGAVALEQGDRVVLRTQMSEILGLQTSKELRLVDKLSSVQTSTVEVLITPGCRMEGRSLGSMRLRRRYGVYPLAVHRRNQNIGRQLDDVVVQIGDTLLLEGTMGDIQRLAADMEMVDIGHPTERAFRRRHAPIVIAVLAGVVGLSAIDLAPIMLLAFLGVAVVLVTRCIDADEAFGFIDGRLLGMLFGMLAVGAGLEHSGALGLIVGAATPYLQNLSPWMLVLAIFVLTSVLTEVLSNNAVAVVITPIAIGLGQSLGVNPIPLVVTVMMAASASFATPIGYQTNTLVYGPGGYTFMDFVRIGLPLNFVMAAVCTLVVPLIYDM